MALFAFLKKKPELTKEQRKWNKMWELWADARAASPYAELMTYQSEVNNGGHFQYFANVENSSNLRQEMMSLGTILPSKLRESLEKAYKAYLSLDEKDDEKAEETLEQCDALFYEKEGEINQILKEYAAQLEL